MKKDIAKLREQDLVKEREKISKIKIPAQKNVPLQAKIPIPAAPIILKPAPVKPANKLEEILDQQQTEVSEEEKQKVFLMKNQKVSLEKQLADSTKSGNSNITSEKNTLIAEKRRWEEKLDGVIKEKAKAVSDDQKQNIEKKEWVAETEIRKMDDRIEALQQQNKQMDGQKNATVAEIKTIDDSLKNIYLQARPEEQKPQIPVIKKPEIKAIHLQQESPPLEREFLKQAPVALKVKLEQAGTAEQAQRRKFIEDVEKWASEKKEEK